MSIPITEIFSSIQGEGLYVGQRHIFVRCDACNLSCSYCDESNKTADVLSHENIVQRIYEIEEGDGPHAYISLTGGEPLLHASDLILLCSFLKKDFKIYLETNGVLHEELNTMIGLIDVIAMDIKLASVGAESNRFKDNDLFLRSAVKAKEQVFVKIVVSNETEKDEFLHAVNIIAGVDQAIPLVLQPLTDGAENVQMSILNQLHRAAAETLYDVRVIPQFHKMLNIP